MQQQEQPQRPQPRDRRSCQQQQQVQAEEERAQQQQEQRQQRLQEQQQQEEQEQCEQSQSRLQAAAAGIKQRVQLPTLLTSQPRPQGGEATEEKKARSGGLLSGLSGGSGSSSVPEEPADTSSEGNVLGALVQKVVASFDDSVLGVKVHIDSMKLEPISGAVEVRGLRLDNPQGFKSAYLLHADKVVVRVNVARFISSLGGNVEVNEVDLDNVDVIYEKALTTSNLKTLLAKISDSGNRAETSGKSKPGNDQDAQVTLHKIAVRNVGAKVCTSLSAMAGPRLAVGDITFEDFDKKSGGAKKLMQIVQLVLATLLKSILASILGKRATEGMTRAAGGLRSGISGAVSQAVQKSRTTLAHVPLSLPFVRARSSGTEDAADCEAPAPTSRWCGRGSAWCCCREVALQEQGEVVFER